MSGPFHTSHSQYSYRLLSTHPKSWLNTYFFMLNRNLNCCFMEYSIAQNAPFQAWFSKIFLGVDTPSHTPPRREKLHARIAPRVSVPLSSDPKLTCLMIVRWLSHDCHRQGVITWLPQAARNHMTVMGRRKLCGGQRQNYMTVTFT